MEIGRFSPKQRRVLGWWRTPGDRDREIIICDGAVRSGKTLCLGLSFFLWAMTGFDKARFALCAKTILGARRGLLVPLLPLLRELGFDCRENITRSELTVGLGKRENTFYLFGGKDEGSAALIQGLTLAGALLDEAALMPRSFVEQACARCSVDGARLWFSCNPEGPEHWFYREWICKAGERNALYLHFTMEDNPALSPRVRRRYEEMFRGAFYRRFILGEWTAPQGLVYDFFSPKHCPPPPDESEIERWCVSCDYGTVNPASFGLWGLRDGVWYRMREFYYDSRREGRQKTDGEYAQDLARLVQGKPVECVVADPSAASLIETLRREGWRVVRAKNDVLPGIRLTAGLLQAGRLVICNTCADAIREFGLYRWEEDLARDRVVKQNDHAMDDIRYFAATVACREAQTPVFAGTVRRRT